MSVKFYQPIQDKLLKARECYYKYASGLKPPLNDLAIKYAKPKNKTILSGGLLGEFCAFWCGEPLQLKDEILQEASLGCITGCTYFILEDNWIDDPGKYSPNTHLLGNLLFAKMVECFFSASQANHKFWQYLYKYLEEFAEGCLWEQEQHNHPKSFTNKDFIMTAKRSAPINICISSLALAVDKEDIIPILAEAIEKLIIGLQLRDDLTDWEEDLKKGMFTYPVSLAIKKSQKEINFKNFDLIDINYDEIKKFMTLSEIAETMIEQSTDYLNIAKEMTSGLNMSLLNLYIDFILEENKEIKSLITSRKTEYAINTKGINNLSNLYNF